MQKLVEESGVVMFLRYWSFQVAVHRKNMPIRKWTNLKIAAGILPGRDWGLDQIHSFSEAAQSDY